MKKTLLALAAFAALSTSSMAFSQEQFSLEFSGQVTAGACNVSTDELTEIALGTASVKNFETVGATTGWGAEKSIKLDDCSTTVDGKNYNKAKLTFSGTASTAPGYTYLWAPSTGANAATGVGVEVQVNKSRLSANNATYEENFTEGESKKFGIRGRLVSTSNAVTTGNVNLALVAELTYLE